jgi:hypothetical protein
MAAWFPAQADGEGIPVGPKGFQATGVAEDGAVLYFGVQVTAEDSAGGVDTGQHCPGCSGTPARAGAREEQPEDGGVGAGPGGSVLRGADSEAERGAAGGARVAGLGGRGGGLGPLDLGASPPGTLVRRGRA